MVSLEFFPLLKNHRALRLSRLQDRMDSIRIHHLTKPLDGDSFDDHIDSLCPHESFGHAAPTTDSLSTDRNEPSDATMALCSSRNNLDGPSSDQFSSLVRTDVWQGVERVWAKGGTMDMSAWSLVMPANFIRWHRFSPRHSIERVSILCDIQRFFLCPVYRDTRNLSSSIHLFFRCIRVILFGRLA